MIVEIKIPSPGESITEVEIANWLVKNGDYVTKDQELAEIESDKATLPLIASESGKITILLGIATTLKVGQTACTIDTGAEKPAENKTVVKTIADKATATTWEINLSQKEDLPDITEIPELKKPQNIKITPLAKKMADEHNLSIDDIVIGLQKITTREVEQVINLKPALNSNSKAEERTIEKQRMTPLRRKISERLVAAKNQTAMLTTFNEVDMSAVMEMREKNQKKFTEKYGIKLGFMSFFAKASAIALKKFPGINSYIDGEQICSPKYVDICIAVQTDKGLMVPVLKNTESLTIPELEMQIAEMAIKARNYKLTPEELTGGTFTITNGGVFGSLLSTPIINPPQSGILGLHKIQERPIALNGKVEIRPMMYVALSYDHRIVDGRESVSFLATIKSLLENPGKLLTDGSDIDALLLGF